MSSVAGTPLAPEADLDLGVAGASSRRQHQRLAEQFGWAPEVSAETGAEGEEQLAAHLARTCPDAIVLHDRALPSIHSNIDHLAVTANGVWVIDAQPCGGKVEVRGALRGEERLVIGGHDSSLLLASLARQRDAVHEAIEPLARELPVHGCFCFVNCSRELPRLRTLGVQGFPLLDPKRLSKRINRPGSLGLDAAKEVAELLASTFPRA